VNRLPAAGRKIPKRKIEWRSSAGALTMPDIMIWIVVLGCVAAIALVAVVIAALIKHLFFR
jgi:hypothetical protein